MQSWAPVTMQADHDIRLFPRVGDTFPLPFGVTDLPLALDKSFKVLSSPYPYFEESRSSLSASSLSSPTRDSTLSDSDVYEGVSDLGSPEESGKRMSFYSIDSLATVKRRRLGDSFDREQTLTSDGERTQWDIIKDDDLPIDLPSDLPLPLIPAIISPDSPTEYDRRYVPQSPFPSLKQTTGFPVLMCGPSEMVERTPSSSSSVEEAAASPINTLKEIRETRCALMGLAGGIRDLLRKGLLDLAQNADESVKLGPNDEIIRDITLRALYTLPPMKEPIENCI